MLLWAAEHGKKQLACDLAVLLEEPRATMDAIDVELMVGALLPDALKSRSRQLSSLVDKLSVAMASPSYAPSVGVILAQSYPDWIAMRRPGEPGRYQLACGAGVTIDSEDALAHCQWLVVAQLGGSGKQARVFKAAALDIDELHRFSPAHFSDVDVLGWDNAQQRVLGEQRVMLGKLLISSRQMSNISDADKACGLLDGIKQQGLTCLPWTDESREWQARVLRMRKLAVQGVETDWPDVSNEALGLSLDSWLLPFLLGKGSMKALQQLDLLSILKSMLDYQQLTLLDEWLPRRYTVPSGSSIQLSYTTPGNPVLSVKLQEMLGCNHNPSIANGQIVLKVELLSPARRPVQITEDLANFWINSYPAVKKDMAGRYPKHVWPDDPLLAQATARAKPRKKR